MHVAGRRRIQVEAMWNVMKRHTEADGSSRQLGLFGRGETTHLRDDLVVQLKVELVLPLGNALGRATGGQQSVRCTVILLRCWAGAITATQVARVIRRRQEATRAGTK
jgi:hypothetical protein